uniref:Uncharacterized protein n=1 Tax=Romanomermis culicivorax TaxID=13658 RepID=A0A915KDL1_ROMCU
MFAGFGNPPAKEKKSLVRCSDLSKENLELFETRNKVLWNLVAITLTFVKYSNKISNTQYAFRSVIRHLHDEDKG